MIARHSTTIFHGGSQQIHVDFFKAWFIVKMRQDSTLVEYENTPLGHDIARRFLVHLNLFLFPTFLCGEKTKHHGNNAYFAFSHGLEDFPLIVLVDDIAPKVIIMKDGHFRVGNARLLDGSNQG